MKQRYRELMMKYCGNNEIQELIELVILDDKRVRENHYSQFKKYPEQQDLLMKLKSDLYTTKKVLEEGGNK